MLAENKELLYAFLVVSVVFLILTTIIIWVVRHHGRKVDAMAKEKELMRVAFEKGMLISQLEVEENTRRHISREIHDNLGSLSSLIKINLGLLAGEKNDIRKEQLLVDSQTLIKNLTIELKQLSVRLNADSLDLLSLPEMLARDVQYLKRLGMFQIDFDIQGEEFLIPADKKIIIYRICQELLNNCLKHAQPELLTITLFYLEKELKAVVEDNGVGFDLNEKKLDRTVDGSGLHNMLSRAKLLGGDLLLNSAPGKGMRCILTIPLLNS
jgi:signal transduction histidine kinase